MSQAVICFHIPASIPHLLPNHPERKRVASEHRRLQPVKGISWGILHEQRQDLITFPGNPFRLQRPPPLLLQVPGRQEMPGGTPSDAHIFLQFSDAHNFLQFFKTSAKSNSGDRVERGELLGPDADPA